MTPRVVVVGGGISGLACAYRLQELLPQADIQVLEAQNHLGGMCETMSRDGFLLEGAPDAFMADRPFIHQWLEKTGLKSFTIGTNANFRASFCLKNGKLSQFPKGFYIISPTSFKSLLQLNLSFLGKLRMALEYWLPPRKDEKDESVSEFISRRFGREALIRIGQPMVGGIYTADPALLSLQAAMPRFYEMEKEHGSVIRALKVRQKSAEQEASGPRYSLFLSMARGMGQMIEELAARMPKVKIRTAFPVVRMENQGAWKLTSENGESLEADAVCLAVSSHRAARLIGPFAPAIANQLDSIPYESAVTVNLAYRASEIPEVPQGFGVVVPSAEKRKIIGMTFSSRKFPGRAPEDHVLVRVFLGGALHRDIPGLSDPEILAAVRTELKDILKIEARPVFSVLRRYPRAMPQYHVGHLDKVKKIFSDLRTQPGLFLTGNAYWGVGIPECIARAEQAAEQMVEYLGSSHD